jgi:hypothetical protein
MTTSGHPVTSSTERAQSALPLASEIFAALQHGGLGANARHPNWLQTASSQIQLRPLRIIGGGIHGLMPAICLAERSIRDIRVFAAGYWQGGASGRNGTLVRPGFSSPEWTRLFSPAELLNRHSKPLKPTSAGRDAYVGFVTKDALTKSSWRGAVEVVEAPDFQLQLHAWMLHRPSWSARSPYSVISERTPPRVDGVTLRD